MLNIKPYKRALYNCYDNNIITQISNYWKIDYRPYFLGGFKFHFDNLQEDLSKIKLNDISTGSYYSEKILYRFSGIKLTYSKDVIKDMREFIELLKTQLNEEKPVGIWIDSYYLPWSEYYLEIFRKHCFLIIGINEEENILYCVDGYLSNKIETISINEVFEHHDNLIYFEKKEAYIKKIDPSIVIKYVLKSLSYEKALSNQSSIMKFRELISNSEITSKYIEDIDDVNKSELIFIISKIALARYHFADTLKHMNNICKTTIFNEVIQEAFEIHKEWEKVKNMMIKGIYTKSNRYFEKASKILYDLSIKEEGIIKKFLVMTGDI
jgi:hypothetical protein